MDAWVDVVGWIWREHRFTRWWFTTMAFGCYVDTGCRMDDGWIGLLLANYVVRQLVVDPI
jgi:hypothetical protein